jgi:hypothetical protein
MKHMIVDYTVKADMAEENARLVRAVFEELNAKRPAGLRYMSLRADEGRFLHFVAQAATAPALTQFEAFQTFQADFAQRCLIRPQVSNLDIVGNFGMLPEQS